MISTFIQLFKIFFQSKKKTYAYGMGLFIIGMSLSTVYMSYLFNGWRGRFWQSVQDLNTKGFMDGLLEFIILAFIFILLVAFLRYLAQMYCLNWRKQLTNAFLDKWLILKKRNIIENADQRLQIDLERFVSLTQNLIVDVISCIATLVVFIPLLYDLSKGVVLYGYTIPGYFVWIAISWAILGSSLSYFVGKKLPTLEYNNQKTEADFRYQLVLARDGASISKLKFMFSFAALFSNHRKLFNYQKYYNLFATSFSQVNIILPVLASFPLMVAKILTLGVLFQVMHAFSAVVDSMSYIVTNYMALCDLAATLRRLNEFMKQLENT